MVKGGLKNRLDGNELDLSLLSLDDVPVKEIAELNKATLIDLSSNRIKAIPPALCCLTNIVKLDLSKNLLASLPNNFGDLTRLQYLDLSNNKISTLPVSFYQLKNLKWLDLKDNPLNEHLKLVVGDCLDQKQCINCAKQVVRFMDEVNDQLVHKENQRIEKERRVAAARLQKAKDKLIAAKETKKITPPVIHRVKVAEENDTDSHEVPPKVSNNDAIKASVRPKKNNVKQLNKKATQARQDGFSLLQKAFIVLVVLVSSFIGALYIYTGQEFTRAKIEVALVLMKSDALKALSKVQPAVTDAVHWIQVDAWPILQLFLRELASFWTDVWEIATLVFYHSIDYFYTLYKFYK